MKNYKLVSGILIAAAVSASASADIQKSFTAKKSTEAELRFNYRVEYVSSSGNKPSETKALDQIDKQVMFLFGSLGRTHAPLLKAAPKGDYKATVTAINPGPVSGSYSIEYSYFGKIALEIDPQNPNVTQIPLLLPRNPDKIFDQAKVVTGGSTRYPCLADQEHREPEFFWYMWSPYSSSCVLKQGVHYDKIAGSIKRLPNTPRSFPVYKDLVQSNGEIRVDLIMGMNDNNEATTRPDGKSESNPDTSSDINASNYLQIRNSLKSMGFTSARVWTDSDKRTLTGGRDVRVIPHVEDLVKKSLKATIRVRMFFGPTTFDAQSFGFMWFLRDALANSSVMMYAGHSSLGRGLNLALLEDYIRRGFFGDAPSGFRFQPNQNRYQIYFLNGCSTYAYYNSIFFDRKKTSLDLKGTKNLDVLTNGLETFFHVMDSTNLQLIQAIDYWAQDKATLSYQQLAQAIDSNNLFGVNGDEDENNVSP